MELTIEDFEKMHEANIFIKNKIVDIMIFENNIYIKYYNSSKYDLRDSVDNIEISSTCVEFETSRCSYGETYTNYYSLPFDYFINDNWHDGYEIAIKLEKERKEFEKIEDAKINKERSIEFRRKQYEELKKEFGGE